MTVNDLIVRLGDFDPDHEVIIATGPSVMDANYDFDVKNSHELSAVIIAIDFDQ